MDKVVSGGEAPSPGVVALELYREYPEECVELLYEPPLELERLCLMG